MTPPRLDDIRRAASALYGHIVRTPLLEVGNRGFRVKCENLQRGGSFKLRGALTRLLAIPPEARKRGVVAFSSGNHAQGVAIAARILGMKATIVMPEDALPHKVEATKAQGATVVQQGINVQTRGEAARKIAEETGATIVPPFDDPDIIRGQGTTGLEIMEAWPDVENVVVPLGGGGLLAGVALAVHGINPRVRVFGVEPEAGNDGQRSLHRKERVTIPPPQTIADGARTTVVGERNFQVLLQHVEDIVTVPDDALLDAIRVLALEAHVVTEPTGALGAAALLQRALKLSGRTCVVLSGGNVAPEVLASALAAARPAGRLK
ncbi:MAG: threonine ammonia-lyase [Candidatus Xenobia bacterium]